MPNPYDDLFDADDDDKKRDAPASQQAAGFKSSIDLDDPRFQHTGPEALDEILTAIQQFNGRAAGFGKLLSELRVPDHEVSNRVARLFFVVDDPQDRGSLAGERQYHELQEQKFRLIVEPMRGLAELHLNTVKQFNRDIDEHYHSVEKSERQVKSDLTLAMDGINLQRRVLGDAHDHLNILAVGLKDTERRMKYYVNAGGTNNISASEYELIGRKREALTTGREHGFDYEFFDVNLLDKTAIGLGIYLKETSSQYLSKLERAMG
ncbi:hypothetical protein [Neolewinella antarctica]|uniref:Uncharacterized protein n=1 Tax=Neolewinella antarctica TaxID=442734 RepID=A0ABX0X7Y7_9BACT|nr:hypothetical protein [Neolewinella antarctica]NJC25330.1 hypothetical protein [Neolewinella antarctica]